jgi:hypothetical protein
VKAVPPTVMLAPDAIEAERGLLRVIVLVCLLTDLTTVLPAMPVLLQLARLGHVRGTEPAMAM